MTTTTTSPRWPTASQGQILHSLALVLCMGATFLLGLGVIGPALGVQPDEFFTGSSRALLMTALMGSYSVAVVALGLLALGRVRAADLGWRSEHMATDVAYGLLGALLLVLGMMAVMVAFGADVREAYEVATRFTPAQRLQMLMIGVIAGFGEESVFRGYLQPALCSKFGVWWGLSATAVIFALYHVPVTPHAIGLTAKLMFGIILGLLRHKTGGLWAPAIAHFVFWQIAGFA
jgi:uncharacterized protein